MKIIETRRLEKTYGSNGTAVHALRGIDLSVESGEMLALIGPSGSGKSTLLRMMNRQERPEKGSVWVADDQGAQVLRVARWHRRVEQPLLERLRRQLRTRERETVEQQPRQPRLRRRQRKQPLQHFRVALRLRRKG